MGSQPLTVVPTDKARQLASSLVRKSRKAVSPKKRQLSKSKRTKKVITIPNIQNLWDASRLPPGAIFSLRPQRNTNDVREETSSSCANVERTATSCCSRSSSSTCPVCTSMRKTLENLGPVYSPSSKKDSPSVSYLLYWVLTVSLLL